MASPTKYKVLIFIQNFPKTHSDIGSLHRFQKVKSDIYQFFSEVKLQGRTKSELLEGPVVMIRIIGGARTPILTVISKILTLQYLDFKIIGGATAPLAPPVDTALLWIRLKFLHPRFLVRNH